MAGKLSKSLSIFGWHEPTATVPGGGPHPRPTSARYSQLAGLERSYVEPADNIGPTATGMTVYYERERDVQEMTFWGANQCLEKQTKRGARNPWRQYGALRKLHEIGGNAPEKMDKKGRKKGANYVKIKKGTSPPQAPTTPEIVLNGTKDVGLLKRLHVPPGVPAEQLAHQIGQEMQRMARDSLRVGRQTEEASGAEATASRSRSRKTRASHKSK